LCTVITRTTLGSLLENRGLLGLTALSIHVEFLDEGAE
jgi:hypothetical protein